MNQKFKIKFVLLFLIGATVSAQEKWTLDDCVAYALEHNLTLKDYEFNMASNKETHKQSVRDLLPSVGGYADYNLRFGRSEDPNSGTKVSSDFFSNNYSLNSSIGLFQGFQKINAIKASKFLFKAAQEDLIQEKYSLAFRVMSAYYDIRFYEGLVTNTKEQSEISQTNYNLVQKQVELGLKAGADLYDAEATLLSDKLLVTQSENQLAVAELLLVQEMNLEGVTKINLASSLNDYVESSKFQRTDSDSIYMTALNFLPLIKAEGLRVDAAKKNIAVARGNLYPSISLGAGYGTGYFETNTDQTTGKIIPFRTQITDNASRYVGVSMNIPISDKWSRRSIVKQRKIEFLRARNNLDVQEQELQKQIKQLLQENLALQSELDQSTKKVEAQQLSFTIAKKKYEKGLISALELFQAKNLFANAQNENLQVGIRLRVNGSTLEFYNGLPIFNIN
jgi:outer membrane protein